MGEFQVCVVELQHAILSFVWEILRDLSMYIIYWTLFASLCPNFQYCETDSKEVYIQSLFRLIN